MTDNLESIPIDQPGEQIPSGVTFAEAFGLTFTKEGSANLTAKMDQIVENERQAAIVGRTILIGSSDLS